MQCAWHAAAHFNAEYVYGIYLRSGTDHYDNVSTYLNQVRVYTSVHQTLHAHSNMTHKQSSQPSLVNVNTYPPQVYKALLLPGVPASAHNHDC